MAFVAHNLQPANSLLMEVLIEVLIEVLGQSTKETKRAKRFAIGFELPPY